MTVFGFELPSMLLVGMAGLLFAVAGLSLVGHAIVGHRDAVASRVNRLGHGLSDRVATAGVGSIQVRAPTSLVGIGMFNPAEEAELARRLAFLRIPPGRTLEAFFVFRLVLAVLCAVALSLGLSHYGEALPKLIRL